jgi:hypothetical protein
LPEIQQQKISKGGQNLKEGGRKNPKKIPPYSPLRIKQFKKLLNHPCIKLNYKDVKKNTPIGVFSNFFQDVKCNFKLIILQVGVFKEFLTISR